MNKQIEALKLVIDFLNREGFIEEHEIQNVIETCKEALGQPACNPHPKAPHGFNRDASHSADRYVCDCEGWDAWQDGYDEGLRKGLALDTKQVCENAAPAQEPVAEVYETEDGWEKVYIGTMLVQGIPNGTKLYTHPSTWQSLSDDEIDKLLSKFVECLGTSHGIQENGIPEDSAVKFIRAIEQAHGIGVNK
jgi:hypothetical protein